MVRALTQGSGVGLRIRVSPVVNYLVLGDQPWNCGILPYRLESLDVDNPIEMCVL